MTFDPPREHTVDLGSMADEGVVEFGDDGREPRRSPFGSWLGGRGVPNDRRLALGAAGLAAVLIFLSLIQVWQTTTLSDPNSPQASGEVLIERLGSMGPWATAYLVGVFGLVLLASLLLFGPPTVRVVCRVSAYALSGSVGALLVALLVRSTPVGYPFTSDMESRLEVASGPGPLLALAGVAALAFACYQADKTAPEIAPAPAPVVAPVEPESTWQPPVVGGPVDLTVAPITPFRTLPEAFRDR